MFKTIESVAAVVALVFAIVIIRLLVSTFNMSPFEQLKCETGLDRSATCQTALVVQSINK